MAIFHASAKMISRGAGKSLVQKTAYICGRNIFDEYCGMMRSYQRKDVVFTKVILPAEAPAEYTDVQSLISAIDRSEKRKDAQTARELILALPIELTAEEHVNFVCKCIKEFWISLGMCAIIAIHDAGTGNPHAHALLTTRNVDQNGFSSKKNRSWNKRALYRFWREFYAEAMNSELKRKGVQTRVSCESYAVQGVDVKPTHYLGPTATALKQKGIFTERAMENVLTIEERKRQEREREEKRQRRKSRARGRSR